MADNSEDKGIKITIPQALIFTVVIAVATWGWNVERRMTMVESAGKLNKRIENVENALMPILVEFKVKEELEKREMVTPHFKPPEITEEAKKWAVEQMPNSMNAAKK